MSQCECSGQATQMTLNTNVNPNQWECSCIYYANPDASCSAIPCVQGQYNTTATGGCVQCPNGITTSTAYGGCNCGDPAAFFNYTTGLCQCPAQEVWVNGACLSSLAWDTNTGLFSLSHCPGACQSYLPLTSGLAPAGIHANAHFPSSTNQQKCVEFCETGPPCQTNTWQTTVFGACYENFVIPPSGDCGAGSPQVLANSQTVYIEANPGASQTVDIPSQAPVNRIPLICLVPAGFSEVHCGTGNDLLIPLQCTASARLASDIGVSMPNPGSNDAKISCNGQGWNLWICSILASWRADKLIITIGTRLLQVLISRWRLVSANASLGSGVRIVRTLARRTVRHPRGTLSLLVTQLRGRA